MNIGVLGGGSWGTTVAHLLSRRYNVTLWARNSDIVNEINVHHTNHRYLSSAQLSQKLQATDRLQDATNGQSVLVMAIPAQNFRAVLTDAAGYLDPLTPIVSLSKGLEFSTGARMTEIIQAVCPKHPAAVLTGPNLAREVMAGFAAASVLATPNAADQSHLQSSFHSPLFRV
jgi:glycerol-3-phosphate dehydrogenase (NAD(P)+)